MNIKSATQIIKWCIYEPNDDKLLKIENEYINNKARHLYIEIIDNLIVGVIGIEYKNEIEILHIAVHPKYRNNNIGRKMIYELMKIYKNQNIIAETDEDAVDFYRKCGFIIESLGEKYPGIERFKCTKKAA